MNVRQMWNPAPVAFCSRAVGLLGCLVVAALPATAGGAVDAAALDACALLTDAEVQRVQGRAVVERIPSAQRSATLNVLQCVYRSDDFTSSVSLALTVPVEGTEDGPQRYWDSRFHPAGGHQGKEDPPRPVPNLGDEAFWAGDARVGSLYVLVDGRFLRISVGGVRDAEVREQRAMSLAAQALTRTAAAGSPAPR